MQLYEYLNCFHNINTADYDLLSSNFKTKSFKKGALLIAPGQTQKELFFVRSGVQMAYADSSDKTHVIAFTYPPDLCAIPSSFSFQQPSEYTLTCLTDTEMDCISYIQLERAFDQSQRLERLFRKVTEAVLAGMITRHIELHSLTMEERYRSFCNRSPHLLQLVPHKHIASYLGIDATNFSKLFNSIKF